MGEGCGGVSGRIRALSLELALRTTQVGRGLVMAFGEPEASEGFSRTRICISRVWGIRSTRQRHQPAQVQEIQYSHATTQPCALLPSQQPRINKRLLRLLLQILHWQPKHLITQHPPLLLRLNTLEILRTPLRVEIPRIQPKMRRG